MHFVKSFIDNVVEIDQNEVDICKFLALIF